MEKSIDWTTYKFHCSGLANLMVASRKKDDPLSETTKAYLREVYIKEVWGRERTDMAANKYIQKGVMCETDSIELVEKVTGQKYFKNLKTLENDYLIGTPDVVKPDLVDIKTSWDLFTFSGVDEEKARKDYYYQLLGYMWLTGIKESILMYCLVNTPEVMITDELYRLSFKLPEEEAERYRHNFIYDDIPEKMRVKAYRFEYLQEDVLNVQAKIKLARDYLLTISL